MPAVPAVAGHPKHVVQLEAIQKRAIRIIYSCTCDMPFTNTLFIADLTSLAERREQLSRRFFHSVTQPMSCLHGLLPPQRDSGIVSRLRVCSKFPRIPSRSKKYQTFLSFALTNYQTRWTCIIVHTNFGFSLTSICNSNCMTVYVRVCFMCCT
jgi:hypothetical protein